MTLLHSASQYVSLPEGSRTIAPPIPGIRHPFVPPSNIKGLFAGAGADGMEEPFIARAIVDLTGLPPEDVHVLYIGTATCKFRNSNFAPRSHYLFSFAIGKLTSIL